MEKKSYYISIQARTIMAYEEDASYEFEIYADEEEIEKLQLLFDDLTEIDQASMIRSGTPGIPYHHDEVNDEFDNYLQSIYHLVYQLGTQSTKHHIEQMKICSLPN